FHELVQQALVERAEAPRVEDLDLRRLRRDRLSLVTERELDAHPLEECMLEAEHVSRTSRQVLWGERGHIARPRKVTKGSRLQLERRVTVRDALKRHRAFLHLGYGDGLTTRRHKPCTHDHVERRLATGELGHRERHVETG